MNRKESVGGYELLENGTVRPFCRIEGKVRREIPDKEEEYYGFRRDRAASAADASASFSDGGGERSDS